MSSPPTTPVIDEPGIFKQIAQSFRGRNGWVTVMVWLYATAFMAGLVTCAVLFFGAETTRTQIAYATGFLACFQAVMMLK